MTDTNASDSIRNEAGRFRALRGIKSWIETGVLPVGEALPSERALSERLDVDRTSVRWAIQSLRRDGILRKSGPRTQIVTARSNEEAIKTSMLANSIVMIHPLVGQPGQSPTGGWASSTAWGAGRAIQAAGLDIFSVNPSRVSEYLTRLAEGRPAGLVIPQLELIKINEADIMHIFKEHGVPVVIYGGENTLTDWDRVYSDHDAGCYTLTQWLIQKGCKRPQMFFCARPEMYWVKARRTGYERAMREAGLEPLPFVHMLAAAVEETANSPETFQRQLRGCAGYLVEFLNSATPPDGILVDSDGHFFSLAAACRLLGRIPGKDLLIVGYDNYWKECYFRDFDPAIPAATVDKLNYNMGEEMVKLLLERRSGMLPESPQSRIMKPALVVTGENGG